ncbi:uncharacterized protein BJ171DRAFT_459036 [Polychytrium aggregatum]|uniref:uncharacterized protein n=1 Tax=Polychytrium aggregatum TaxID=110093 RepID=UPI0022FE4AA8|nr:uncharacterized protein BJ171DRAFT_459036 [Polychytrium aggregatum]KAI9204872.1 hypothetical protein BJ171DRAFT_459036 [Polychytrium aggregatum]
MMQSDRSAFWFWQEVSTKSTDAVLKPIATHIVGWMHYLGRGTQLDKQKGIKIIRENSTNEFKLGEDECLAGGTGCSSNSPAACKFFDLCQQGSDRDWLCRHLMAVCLFLGFGTTQDRKKAVSIFEQLANKGHSDSRLWIGKCFMGIEEVPEDLRKAFEWFFKSATEGNPYGQWMVGECFSNGWGVTKDIAKAFEWYGKSAENGNRSGQFYVGCCYEFETGVSKNLDTAIFWYRKSAKQGYQVAINSLKYLGKWP